MNPLCFVLMPFGRKPAGSGLTVDFDAVYAELIAPAIEAAGLEPLPTDSPVFELVEGFPDIQRLKTDVFRDRVKYRAEVKARLAAARKQGADAVKAVEASLGSVSDQEAGVLIDLFLSYRAVKSWKDMIALAAVREKWEPETTARNLRLIREARERRGGEAAWASEVEAALQGRAQTA